jgi:hypothetical protein
MLVKSLWQALPIKGLSSMQFYRWGGELLAAICFPFGDFMASA